MTDNTILLFDFGGVLVDLDRERCVRAFADLGFDITPYLGTFAQGGIFSELESGKITPHKLCDELRQQSGRNDLTDEQLIGAWKRYPVGVPSDRLALLEKVREHYPLYVLSNTNPIHWDMTDEELIDYGDKKLKNFFSDCYLSYKLGLQKPDPAIFHEVVRRIGAPAKNILFFDDSTANCEAAPDCGLRARLAPAGGVWKGFFTADGRLSPSCVATIGTFDGVHLGHQYLLRQVVKEAKRRQVSSLALTFEHHPAFTLNDEYMGAMELSTIDERRNNILQTDISRCEVLRFDKALASQTARDFMEHTLRDNYGVECLVIGYDQHFGSDLPDFDSIKAIGAEVGIEVVQSDEYGSFVCSSSVREALEENDVEKAANYLGHYYTLVGDVVHGEQLGGTIGYPTLNIRPKNECQLLPAIGSYAAFCEVNGKRYQAMVAVTRRPTTGNHENVVVEAHLFDYTGNLYGQQVTLYFDRFLRFERKFSSLKELQRQLKEDERIAREILSGTHDAFATKGIWKRLFK